MQDTSSPKIYMYKKIPTAILMTFHFIFYLHIPVISYKRTKKIICYIQQSVSSDLSPFLCSSFESPKQRKHLTSEELHGSEMFDFEALTMKSVIFAMRNSMSTLKTLANSISNHRAQGLQQLFNCHPASHLGELSQQIERRCDH